ncbi:MAG: hypothetical protein E7653_00540 [Ruminococcaceae bacterium]|nr:hypothetical protein [Oscillospiraceae bacterium]
MQRSKRYVNFKAIGLSLIFLFNPNINIIDVLPDFIGYILLCLALVKLADLNDTLSEALDAFKKLIIIDAAKILALMWTFGISVSSERNSSILLWAFVFGVLELIFVIPAFIKLFKGLSEIGYLYENSSIIASKRAYSKNKTDKLCVFTVVFLGFKALMSFVPELLNLTSPEYYDGNTTQNLYQFIGTIRLLAFVPTLIFGIVWLCRVLAYFKKVNSDEILMPALDKAYAEKVLPRDGIFIIRNVTTALLILAVSCVLCFDLRLENINVIPDFLSAVLLICFFIVLGKKIKIKKAIPILLGAVYFVTSALASFFEFKFFENYYYSAVYRSADALNAYRAMLISSIANVLAFVAIFVCVLISLKKIIAEHCGHITISGESASGAQLDMSIKKELNKNIIICAVGLAVYAITNICYVLLAKEYGFMFFIDVVGAIIFVVTFFKAYFDISAAVKAKYILS